MSHTKSHQQKLHIALGEAIASPGAPEFMTAELEAMALDRLCRDISEQLRGGYCLVPRLMVLCQQALRCAAVAYTQNDEREVTVACLIGRTVPGGLE